MCIRDRLSQQHRGPPEGEERPYENMVDTSPRLMSSSILVHTFWPPLLLDLLLLLCRRRRRRRRRYYCCCCCYAVTRSCVRSKKHKTRNSLLRQVVLRDASRVVKQQQHSSSTAAAAASTAAAAAAAAARQQQRPAPLRSLGAGCCVLSPLPSACAISVCVHPGCPFAVSASGYSSARVDQSYGLLEGEWVVETQLCKLRDT